MKPKQELETIFLTGLAQVKTDQALFNSVQAYGHYLTVMDETFDLDRYERIAVVGAGKGCAPMMAVMLDLLPGRINEGLMVVKYGHGLPLSDIEIIEAAHPVPDDNSLRAGSRMLELAENLGEKDLLICLITGGTSAVAVSPRGNISLADKQALNNSLLSCGASIHEMNTLRKHISNIKGGGLARAAYPATVISLIVSDVIGDDPSTIASGPTVGDTTTFEDCNSIIEKYNLSDVVPSSILNFIGLGLEGSRPDSLDPSDPIFFKMHNYVIARNDLAVSAAAEAAKQHGYTPYIFPEKISGEAREVGVQLANLAKYIQKTGQPVATPACVIAGGETTVSMTSHGKGGRNQELALAIATELDGAKGIYALAAGTDGNDGPTDAAGAFAFPDTARRASSAGLNVQKYLSAHNAYPFFETIGDLLITGPTLTNVMDLALILITPADQTF